MKRPTLDRNFDRWLEGSLYKIANEAAILKYMLRCSTLWVLAPTLLCVLTNCTVKLGKKPDNNSNFDDSTSNTEANDSDDNISEGNSDEVDLSNTSADTFEDSTSTQDSDASDTDMESSSGTAHSTGEDDSPESSSTEGSSSADETGNETSSGTDESGTGASGTGESGTEETGSGESSTDSGSILEDWDMYLAVDNQFDVYFGTALKTQGSRVGRGDDWTISYHYTATDKNPSDYMYVATTSDRGGAQGFIGTFNNTTLNKETNTGDDVWEVFAAGAHAATNPYLPDPWPTSVLPTQEEVDTAIAYAEMNDLWVKPTSVDVFDNDPSTDPTENTPWTWNPWQGEYDGITSTAKWIWFDSGKIADGNIPGVFAGGNHDEFLIFRIRGEIVPQ